MSSETREQLGISSPEKRNFNDEVLVRVTPSGEAMWAKHFREARIALGKPEAFPLLKDEEGYTKLQLHEVMTVFGSGMAIDVADPPLEMGFRFTGL